MAGGNMYIMSERQDRPYGQENGTDKFSRIGIHCHEFAHLLGIGHTDGSRADVARSFLTIFGRHLLTSRVTAMLF